MMGKCIKGLAMGVFVMVLLVGQASRLSWVIEGQAAEVKPKKSESKSKEAVKEEPKSTKETPVKEGNLLNKGSFETWSILEADNKGTPDGWKLGGDGITYRENNLKHDGEYSLKLSGSEGGQANVNYPYYDVQNFVGKKVTFIAYVKTDTAEGARLRIIETSKEKTPIPDGWQLGGDPIVTKEDKVFHDGTYALKLSGSQGGQANVNYPCSRVKDLSGKNVTFTGYMKTDIPDAGRLRLMEVSKNGSVTEAYSDFHSGSGNWEKLEVSKTLGSSIKMLVLTIFNNSASKEEFVYADTIGCNIKDLLANGDFEKWAKFSEREEQTEVYSDFHSGSGNWEKLEVSKSIGRFPSMVILTIFNFNTSPEDFIYVDEAQLMKE